MCIAIVYMYIYLVMIHSNHRMWYIQHREYKCFRIRGRQVTLWDKYAASTWRPCIHVRLGSVEDREWVSYITARPGASRGAPWVVAEVHLRVDHSWGRVGCSNY
jgi:hypothetical protein